jgi:nucleoside-diphosphate-sugar epimerase
LDESKYNKNSLKKNILITGATGFVGINYLSMSLFKENLLKSSIRKESIPNLSLENIDTILHFAGKAHEMSKIDDEIYFIANRDFPYELALKAKQSGVKQFIFLSSVKVYGKDSTNEILDENSSCQPIDPYGQSKLEGEQKLLSLQDNSFIISIIRPPLIYGAHVKGNINKLLKLADSEKPLPFANIANKRSMVYIGNLIALIDNLIQTRKGGVFIAGDSKSISTTYLVEVIRENLDKPKHLFYLPKPALRLLSVLKPALIKRLFSSLVFDNTKTNTTLNFTPPYTPEEGIKEMVNWYKSLNKK